MAKAKTISTSASNHLIYYGKVVAKSLIFDLYKLILYVNPRSALSDTEGEIFAKEDETATIKRSVMTSNKY